MHDDNIQNSLVDHEGGLKSSWPDWPGTRPSKTKTLFFVDVDGETFATGSRDEMAAMARKLQGTLRQEDVTEEINAKESTIRRARKAVGDFTL